MFLSWCGECIERGNRVVSDLEIREPLYSDVGGVINEKVFYARL